MTQVDRVSGLTGNLGIKTPCRVASTANLTLYGTQTIDGVAVVAEDRVLVKNQTTTSENGIYVCTATDWVRAADFDGSRDVVRGSLVRVHSGTTNANTTWQCSSADPISIGTDAISFEYAMGNELTLGKSILGYFPAASMKPSTTSGCAALAWDESTTYDVMTGYLAFDASTVEYAQFAVKVPKGLDETVGFTALFEWTAAASGDCEWAIQAQAQSNGATIDSPWGSAVLVLDTAASGLRQFSPETAAFGANWTAGDTIVFRVRRQADSGADTLAVDAKLIGVTIYATYVTHVEP